LLARPPLSFLRRAFLGVFGSHRGGPGVIRRDRKTSGQT
jgi:hypothetical protein